jgi:hypothetical protein
MGGDDGILLTNDSDGSTATTLVRSKEYGVGDKRYTYKHRIEFNLTNLDLRSEMTGDATGTAYITFNPHDEVLSPGDSGWRPALEIGVTGTDQQGLLRGIWRIGSLSSSTAVASDLNLKNSVKTMDEKYDKFFDDIGPITYKYNDSTSGRTHTGYIAQQIGSALKKNGLTNQDFAGLVITNYDLSEDAPQMWALRYEEFVSLNTWQIQKAKVRITELEDKVTQLEALIKGE